MSEEKSILFELNYFSIKTMKFFDFRNVVHRNDFIFTEIRPLGKLLRRLYVSSKTAYFLNSRNLSFYIICFHSHKISTLHCTGVENIAFCSKHIGERFVYWYLSENVFIDIQNENYTL